MMPPTLDELAATLAQHGLPILRTHGARPALDLDPAALISALVEQTDGRLAEALIALFLRYPGYAEQVPILAQRLPESNAGRLKQLYTAAVYLQRLWRGTLGLYLEENEELPNYFGQQLWGLPAPDVHYGEAGLRDLAARMREQTGDNWLSTYQSAITLLLTHLRQEARNAA